MRLFPPAFAFFPSLLTQQLVRLGHLFPASKFLYLILQYIVLVLPFSGVAQTAAVSSAASCHRSLGLVPHTSATGPRTRPSHFVASTLKVSATQLTQASWENLLHTPISKTGEIWPTPSRAGYPLLPPLRSLRVPHCGLCQ